MRWLRRALAKVGAGLLLSYALIPSPSFAQIPALGTSSSEATYKLSGTVIDSVTGEPIRRALVQINSQGERLAFTDSNGQFEFDNLPPGMTRVIARKPTYIEQRETDGVDSVWRMTTIGPDSQPVVLKLIPQSVISGHVTTPNGEPIEGIPVKVMTNQIVDGRKRWQQAGGTSTDEDGSFRIAHLHPGSYYVEAGPSKDLGDSSSGDRGYPATFYPAATDVSAASSFNLGPGQQAEADLSLGSVRLFKVSGRLAGYVPGSGIDFEFLDHLGNNFSFMKQFHPESGQFMADVPAGSYILQVSNWMRNGNHTRGETTLNVNSDLSGVELALGSVLPVPITVRTEGTKPENFRSRRQNGQQVSVHLVRDDGAFEGTDVWSSSQGGPNQSPVLPDVQPGRYSVQIIPSDGSWYVQSAQCGDTDLLDDDLTVTAGVQLAAIDIVLRDDSATLTIRLHATSNSRRARVVLVPDRRSPGQIKSVDSGTQDEVSIPSLAPGSYSVLAFDVGNSVEYANREVLDQYLSRAAHVTLDPNGQEQITLDVISVHN